MSKAIGLQSIRQLLGTSHPLNRLNQAAREAGRDQSRLSELLPPALADKVTLIREDNRLCLLAGNNAVAQLARFHAPRLEQACGLPVHIRVSRETDTRPAPTRPAPTLPHEAGDCLRQAADCVEDEDLAASLRRLATRAGE